MLPEVDDIEIRDWAAYEAAVRQGALATTATLAKLPTSVTEIRRRPPLAP